MTKIKFKISPLKQRIQWGLNPTSRVKKSKKIYKRCKFKRLDPEQTFKIQDKNIYFIGQNMSNISFIIHVIKIKETS